MLKINLLFCKISKNWNSNVTNFKKILRNREQPQIKPDLWYIFVETLKFVLYVK